MAAQSPLADGGPGEAAAAPGAVASAANGGPAPADPKPLAVDSEAVEFRLKQNHWFPEPSKSDRDAWEGLDVLERDRMVASAARLAFFRGTVERKPVPVRELKRLAGKHGKAIKSMLVREVQRYLRKALGLDFVPAVGLPVPVKGKRTLDHSLEARRDWKQLIVVSRQALSGRLLDPAGTAVADVDAKTAAGVSRVERARRGVLMTCLALIAMGPKQTLPEAELYSLLLQVDPDIALSVGPDWEATVKRWLSEAGAAKVATVTDELPSGATETRRIYCLESGARASVGGMAVASFAAQVGRPGRTPDLARWLGDEALADPEVPGEGGWSDDEGAGAGAAAGHAAAAPPTASAGLTQPSAAGAAAAEAAALPDRRTRSKRARAEAEASGAAGEGRSLRRRR
ncbi:hypothetical protein FNF27_00048 [Cafeteria roenbergensis]|uniref:MAGE domain-containing protein n=1 Tax=Cafeteria roenbergensis TaxID=33653 RepID=A0A5A8ELG9_CAFRO|nr:hypothetical protein FNF27_00048 [Cafeteria roenbergensis]